MWSTAAWIWRAKRSRLRRCRACSGGRSWAGWNAWGSSARGRRSRPGGGECGDRNGAGALHPRRRLHRAVPDLMGQPAPGDPDRPRGATLIGLPASDRPGQDAHHAVAKTQRTRRIDFLVPFVLWSLCGEIVLYLAASATTGALRFSSSLPALTVSSMRSALCCARPVNPAAAFDRSGLAMTT